MEKAIWESYKYNQADFAVINITEQIFTARVQ